MQAEAATCAAKPAHLERLEAELNSAMRERGDARRKQEAEDEAKRRTSKRAAKAAHTSHMLSVPRMAGLMKAGALLGSALALAEALSINPRSLRAKLTADRGVSSDDLEAAAAALEARAGQMIDHAAKLRAECQPAEVAAA
ncbi:hypothetical protein C8J42_103563 [Sphingomonas sp. PP-CE-1A-559]|nr:hypothetical protein C8J42_103563 [Sphingomonas sp. PP-CE-1A-559]